MRLLSWGVKPTFRMIRSTNIIKMFTRCAGICARNESSEKKNYDKKKMTRKPTKPTTFARINFIPLDLIQYCVHCTACCSVLCVVFTQKAMCIDEQRTQYTLTEKTREKNNRENRLRIASVTIYCILFWEHGLVESVDWIKWNGFKQSFSGYSTGKNRL